MYKKSREVFFKKKVTIALLLYKGHGTEHITVKLPIHSWRGFTQCNTSPREGTVPRVLQIIKNELCWNIEITRKHTFMITNKICVQLSFQSFLCTKHISFFNKGYFSSRGFNNIRGLLQKIQGL